ncbi:MAG TPA: hypothetical protein VF719_02860, partial [Abditibacteriaceae bacterium]
MWLFSVPKAREEISSFDNEIRTRFSTVRLSSGEKTGPVFCDAPRLDSSLLSQKECGPVNNDSLFPKVNQSSHERRASIWR